RRQGPGGRLSDRGGQRRQARRQGHGGPDPAGHGGLDEGDGQAAVGQVVGGGQQAAAGQVDQQALGGGRGGGGGGGGAPRDPAGGQPLPGRAAELGPGLA